MEIGNQLWKIAVTAHQNRQFSFTNKRSAYYYGTTHSEENQMWFSGWNVAGKRLLSDYHLSYDQQFLRREESTVEVYPDHLVREFSGIREEFSMIDHEDILVIGLDAAAGHDCRITLNLNLLQFKGSTETGLFFIPHESPAEVILLAAITEEEMKHDGPSLIASPESKGFVLIYASSEDEAVSKLQEFRSNYTVWLNERRQRINLLIEKYIVNTDNDQLNKALPWIGLTLDSLITNQQGLGIYAGLPWFNQYWGRDQFISLPGACLVSGDYAIAKEILLNFAKFQNTDPDSKSFGRIPNRAHPDNIIYNTTDGTPRFVIQIMDYLRYSGDTTIIPDIYPAIKRSIEGSLKFWVDEQGYLTHEETETWMDAEKEGGIPQSPRGNRGNDIQSLWYQQLIASAWLADFMEEPDLADRWRQMAEKVKQNFKRDFFRESFGYMADRLLPSGEQDFKLRPNQLYAFELLDDDIQKAKIARQVWENLVYPWGVASLSQHDPDFHPYHEHWEYYHKDDAYHNGTIWLWNNGMAMQRLIEAGQKDVAYVLFKNMNREALKDGAVGSLAENADALPLPDTHWIRLTGAFLQAWSNAEHLRVWYQYFLGFRPNLINNNIALNPNIPKELKRLNTRIRAGKSSFLFDYQATDSGFLYRYTIEDYGGKMTITIDDFPSQEVHVKDKSQVIVSQKLDQLSISVLESDGRKEEFSLQPDPFKVNQRKQLDELFTGINFVTPYLNPELKALMRQ